MTVHYLQVYTYEAMCQGQSNDLPVAVASVCYTGTSEFSINCSFMPACLLCSLESVPGWPEVTPVSVYGNGQLVYLPSISLPHLCVVIHAACVLKTFMFHDPLNNFIFRVDFARIRCRSFNWNITLIMFNESQDVSNLIRIFVARGIVIPPP